MLSRWYLFFVGLMLLVMGVAGWVNPNFLASAGLSSITPTIWAVTGLLALVIGAVTRNVNTLRWIAGIFGIFYLAWGVVSLFTLPVTDLLEMSALVSMFMTLLGSLGLAASLAPAYWIRERETYAPGHA